MLLCMRTTIDISDDLLRELKRRAAETKRSLKEVIDEALRADLARRRKQAASGKTASLITFKGRGARPGVNLDSTSELLDLMDGTP